MTIDQSQTPSKSEIIGLTTAEVEESRRINGANVLTPPPRDPWWKLYLEKFEDPIIRILLVAAVIAILAGFIEGRFAEGIGIVIAVFLATTLGFINEYKAGQEFDVLNKVSDDVGVKVIREGEYLSIPKKDLVVGDVAALELGEEIPADGEILSAVSFQVDEASLTGESLPVTKRPQSEEKGDEVALAYPRHLVLRGTFVSDGHALVKITSVGDMSEIGKTARAAAEETETITPLNRQLGRLGQLIGVFGFLIALLIFAALTFRAAYLGDLGDQIPIATTAVEAVYPPEADLLAARTVQRAIHGEAADNFRLSSSIQDNKLHWYLNIPLTNGQIYFLIAAFIAMAAALVRVWVPVFLDAFELMGRKRPEIAWIDREGLVPWLQCLMAGGIILAAAVGLGFCLGILSGGPNDWLPLATALTLLGFFMLAVTIIVVAVPEGLPMSVTLSLAYSMRKMTAANNLVRRMHACETIGAATVVCSDKTGTLTMNKMKVNSYAFTNLGVPEDQIGQIAQKDQEIPTGPEGDLIFEAIASDSTADLGTDETGKLTRPIGNPTESALLIWLEELGHSYKALRGAFEIVGQLTFTTERKYMATVGQGMTKDKLTLHAKGAPEIVLDHSSFKRGPDGTVAAMTASDRKAFLEALKVDQGRGMRTLALAYRLIPLSSEEFDSKKIISLVEENQMVFMGFFSIADPIRPEVPPAVKTCTQAGVMVKMVTGDNQATAREIAKEIGIIATDEKEEAVLALTGDEFMALDDEAAGKVALNLRIMSRARPLAKQRLVQILQKNGQVVAVTGDGSNDAPALNHADVGLAMGLTGTAVAKEAADIILLDDSFASIVKAIMWGRSIYANIQKFILFQLSINVLALGVALLGPFLGIQLPLTVTQMLWVNLIMDTFAALALASEPPDWGVMLKSPRKPEAFIVTPDMARFIFTFGGIFLIMFLILVIGFGDVFPMDAETAVGRKNLSIFFTTFVFIQFWNLFNARMLGRTASALSGLKDSRMFLLIVGLVAVGQVLMTQFGGEVFRTTPLSFKEWVLIIVLTSPVLWIGEIHRFIKRSAADPSPVVQV
ncbi:MAG: calcium-translocating P-type ATPase, PMCA-type [Deltaproteobacteria bacterium]|jgi:Ca2+-transporting ATPase|nr:calcium-translocating P-type ATPase, PMCA-type [Deltaproteobacteria bacterium]